MSREHERPVANRVLFQRCLDGREPAEALPTKQRELVVRLLHSRGWTDLEIAVWSRMTTYTTARIRARMRLAPNEAWKGVA